MADKKSPPAQQKKQRGVDEQRLLIWRNLKAQKGGILSLLVSYNERHF
ncbi:hypothetical protein [Izhakiella capsodis]|nr:hypothetical protein [Izhakiella capsodis]